MEALSSLLTGSSLLHTASSMPLGKVVYMIKHTLQHVHFGSVTNAEGGKCRKVHKHSCLGRQI